MKEPLISILIPVKDCEKYIRQSIESVLSQTYAEFELIIIGESSETTFSTIKDFNDDRIKYLSFKGNISQALNFGLYNAKGEYIARIDSDDFMDKHKLEIQIKFSQENPEYNIIGTNYHIINEINKIISTKQLPENHNEIEFIMPIITSVLHPTILMKTSILREMNGYDEKYISCEDTELFLRLLNKYKFYNIQLPLYYYRVYGRANHLKNPPHLIHYELGMNYLIQSKDNQNYLFRMALLEYYRNDMKLCRKYLHQALYKKTISLKKYFRYFIPSLLGNKIIWHLRKKGYLGEINYYIMKKFHYDTSNISG